VRYAPVVRDRRLFWALVPPPSLGPDAARPGPLTQRDAVEVATALQRMVREGVFA